jgi:hypothetical protein
MSEDTENLFPPDGPTWAVITCHKRQTKQEIARKDPKIISHHELLYGGKVITRRTGQAGLDALHVLAKHSNKHNLIPRPAIECLADDSGSIEARLKKQNSRDKTL